MKKIIFISLTAAMISLSGCVNSIKQNESQDDKWIQTQVEKGGQIPEVLR